MSCQQYELDKTLQQQRYNTADLRAEHFADAYFLKNYCPADK